MPVCNLCGELFPKQIWIDGKRRHLNKRKYCLKCSPFGQRNSRKLQRPLSAYTEEKMCCRCNVWKPRDDFYIGRSWCKGCYIDYVREQNTLRKGRAVQVLGGKCLDCGWVGPLCTFDFHHRDPAEKEFIWSAVRRRKWEVIEAEINKCDLLCVNCHRTRHAIESKANVSACNDTIKCREIRGRAIASLGGECKKCTYQGHVAAFDFHHRDPAKKEFQIGSWRKWEVVEKELKKCDLLCARCHRVLHDEGEPIRSPSPEQAVREPKNCKECGILLKSGYTGYCQRCWSAASGSTKPCPTCGELIRGANKYCSEPCMKEGWRVNQQRRVGPRNSSAHRPTKRPPWEELERDFAVLFSYVQVGKKYGVTDNAVRKWVKYYDRDPKNYGCLRKHPPNL